MSGSSRLDEAETLIQMVVLICAQKSATTKSSEAHWSIEVLERSMQKQDFRWRNPRQRKLRSKFSRRPRPPDTRFYHKEQSGGVAGHIRDAGRNGTGTQAMAHERRPPEKNMVPQVPPSSTNNPKSNKKHTGHSIQPRCARAKF